GFLSHGWVIVGFMSFYVRVRHPIGLAKCFEAVDAGLHDGPTDKALDDEKNQKGRGRSVDPGKIEKDANWIDERQQDVVKNDGARRRGGFRSANLRVYGQEIGSGGTGKRFAGRWRSLADRFSLHTSAPASRFR